MLRPGTLRDRNEVDRGLRALLELVSSQADLLARDIARLWDDAFVETGGAWAIPYIAGAVEEQLRTGRLTPKDLRRAIGEWFERDVRSIPRSWWPGGAAAEAFEIRWERGASGAVVDARFRDLTFRALRGPWRAFRGARVPREAYDRALDDAAPLLSPLEDLTIAEVDASVHLAPLSALFRAVERLKPTEAKWVATSKTLYFLLPDLVPPIDNAYTTPFLRRAGVRTRPAIEPETLGAVFGVLSGLGRLVGKPRLRRLSRSFEPPVGMARIVDFAIAARADSVEPAE